MRLPPQIKRLMFTLPIFPCGMSPTFGGGFDTAGDAAPWAARAYSSRLVTRGTARLSAADFLRKFLRLDPFFIEGGARHQRCALQSWNGNNRNNDVKLHK